MKINGLLNELKKRDSYQEYMSKNNDAFFCAGFFILGDDQDKIQIDFFSPKSNKITSFEYPFASYQTYNEEMKNKMNEIKDITFIPDLDKLKEYIKEKTNKQFTRVIAILKDKYWNITLLNGLDLFRIKIDYSNGEIIENNQENLSDIVKFDKKN